MNEIIWAIIGLFVGSIIGYFICALMVIGKISDLELENLQLRERLK